VTFDQFIFFFAGRSLDNFVVQ